MTVMSQQVVKKLSATKQKLSLGEVKKTEKANSSRKVTRTTVINPGDVEWPFITDENQKELIECLSSDFQVLKLPNYYTPLSVISKIEKGDRRQHRHIWHTQRALEVGFDVANYTKLRGDISIGANCVSTALEQDVAKAVIIEKDVDPPLLTKMLIPIAMSKNVPIVAISGLSKACQNVFKIRCIAMGLKVSCGEISHPFSRLYNMILAIWKQNLETSNAYASLVISTQNTDKSKKTSSSITSTSDDNAEAHERGKRNHECSTESCKPPKIRKV